MDKQELKAKVCAAIDARAAEVIGEYKPLYTKETYLAMWEDLLR